MILKGNEDLRVQRTIRSIKATFLKMITETSYAKITVRELSDEAGINKKTFYYYYSSLDHLLQEMQDELLDEYIERLDPALKGDLAKCIEIFFLFFQEKGRPYVQLISHDQSGLLYRKFLVLDEKYGRDTKQRWDNLNDYSRRCIVAYLNMSILQSMVLWFDQGQPIPIEEAIELAQKLTLTGLYGLVNAKGK